MIDRFAKFIWPVFFGGFLLASLLPVSTQATVTSPDLATNAPAEKSLTAPHFVRPGPADGPIGFAAAYLLQKFHYLKQPFDSTVSSKFFDRYLEALDPQHSHFTQADLAEFDHYRNELDHLTLNPHQGADTRPAYLIFNRYVERLQQRVAYVDELLKTEQFHFDTTDRVLLNRREQPYPEDLNEAKKLWRERLLSEYLQEKLGKIDAHGKKSGAKSHESAETDKNGKPKPKKTDAEQIVDTLTHRYHRTLRTVIDWDNDDVLQIYLSALAHAYDPHSEYFGHSQLDSFAITMNLSLFGIGAELVSEDGYCTINRLLPGGPASKSKKIHEKDRIIAVAQGSQAPVDIVDMSLNKAVQMIRGPKGTEVRLTMVPAAGDPSERFVVTMIRDEIKLEDQEAKAKIIEMPNGRGENVRLGVIDLPSFYASFDPSNSRQKSEPKSTTADVSRLITKMKRENVNGIVLDLRRNGGGSLEEAIRLAGLFIKEGPIVQVKSFDNTVDKDDDPDSSVLYEGPLIVMTSRFSASASEIVAGALQDYGRALIVGDSSTHGKGTVQSVNQLKPFLRMAGGGPTNDPGALKLTIKKFYRPSGASTQLRGVVPDIVLPSIWNDSKEFGEMALESALPWDTIEPAKFDHLNLVEPYLPELRKRSTQRVATDQEFSYVREDIQIFKKQQADKTLSLNEKVRLKEKAEIDARVKARDKERLARKAPEEKIYEFTLRQAALPGLPPPVAKTNAAMAKLSGKKGDKTAAGFGTNSTVASVESSADLVKLDGSGEEDEEKPPAFDTWLAEAEHILMDYISMLPKVNVAAASEGSRQ